MISTTTNQPLSCVSPSVLSLVLPLPTTPGVGPLKWVTSEPLFWTFLIFFLRATLVYSLYDWGLISLKTNSSPPYLPLKGVVAFYFTVLLYTGLYKSLIYFF